MNQNLNKFVFLIIVCMSVISMSGALSASPAISNGKSVDSPLVIFPLYIESESSAVPLLTPNPAQTPSPELFPFHESNQVPAPTEESLDDSESAQASDSVYGWMPQIDPEALKKRLPSVNTLNDQNLRHQTAASNIRIAITPSRFVLNSNAQQLA